MHGKTQNLNKKVESENRRIINNECHEKLISHQKFYVETHHIELIRLNNK